MGHGSGLSPDATSKHMAFLRGIGVARSGYGRLYTLAPAYQPAPGATTIHLGHCTIHLP